MDLEFIKNDIAMFAGYMSDDFKAPDHVRTICDKLNEFAIGDCKRLIISMPPRHGKSFLCSQILPQYLMGKDPSCKILTATYSQTLSDNFSREVIRGIKSERFKYLFPDTNIITDNSKGSFFTSSGGHYVSTSRGGTITGLGGNFIILDDLIKNNVEARSRTLLSSLRDWYDTTMYSRLLHGGRILFLMTRWNCNDIIQYVLDNDSDNSWQYINFPALDEDGNALWEEMFSAEYLKEIQARNQRQFECLYQGNPQFENVEKVFELDYLNILDTKVAKGKRYHYYIASWDTASKTNAKSNFTCGTLWGVTYNPATLVLVDYVKFKKTIPQMLETVAEYEDNWKPRYTLVEDANSGCVVLQLNPNYKRIPADVKKKIPEALYLLESGKALLSNFDEVLNELNEYPNGDYDDCVASVVNALWWFNNHLAKGNFRGKETFTRKSRKIKHYGFI